MRKRVLGLLLCLVMLIGLLPITALAVEKNKISVSVIKFEDGKITLSLTPSAIKESDIPKAVAVLKLILN